MGYELPALARNQLVFKFAKQLLSVNWPRYRLIPSTTILLIIVAVINLQYWFILVKDYWLFYLLLISRSKSTWSVKAFLQSFCRIWVVQISLLLQLMFLTKQFARLNHMANRVSIVFELTHRLLFFCKADYWDFVVFSTLIRRGCIKENLLALRVLLFSP